MKLRHLQSLLPFEISVPSERDVEISGVADDSRQVRPGDLFVARRGVAADGRKFIDAAIKAGAAAVALEGELKDANVPVLSVEDATRFLNQAASILYSPPADQYKHLFAVTGTNGKTSVAWLLAHACALIHGAASYLGTLGNKTFDRTGREVHSLATENTTPGAVIVKRFLAEAATCGSRAAALEITSHALAQERVTGIDWNCCVFTNLTRDHLDYHKTFADYAKAKERLFLRELKISAAHERSAVINHDDAFGRELLAKLQSESGIRSVSFSVRGAAEADLRLVRSASDLTRTQITVEYLGREYSLATRLIGTYNIENSLAAFLALAAVGIPASQLCELFPLLPPVPGRLEPVEGQGKTCFIDYAHTPDALVKAQEALRPFVPGRLITVFGCGGDRDRGKRPMMLGAVAQSSEVAIVTSDNPRSEDPSMIIEEVVAGFVPPPRPFELHTEPDRRRAIALALSFARPGDAVLIAGKGHEPYQEIQGVRHPFLDRAVCEELLR